MNRPHLAEAWEYDRPVAWWRGYLRAQLAAVPLDRALDRTADDVQAAADRAAGGRSPVL